MLRAVRQSLGQLGGSSELVGGYVRSQRGPDGGFRDRGGRSDLYYTVFGLELLAALGAPVPPETVAFLLAFGLGDQLDLVHLSCLIRSRAAVGLQWSNADSQALAARIERHRAADGGYDSEPGASTGTAYACFLATMAYEDLELPVPDRDGLLSSLMQLRADDGGFANHAGHAVGLTPTTAAAATLLRSLGVDCPPALVAWLLARRHPDSGFYAVPGAPIPDLLSTATALHALACMNVPLDAFREPCLDFVRSLWSDDGAFAGSWADPTPDCEYTYYGLLALGHLAHDH
jgi:prenyltransferase beta subunit